MRNIIYRYLPPIGSGGASDSVTRSLADFVEELPYFLALKMTPPLEVMNEAFSEGELDAGMSGGCTWKPFAITQEEYEELALELRNRGIRIVETPAWVKNRADWRIWTFELEFGIPADEHYRLWREDEKWAKLKKRAQEEGDEEKTIEYHLKGLKAGERLANFVNPYLRRSHARKEIR